MEERSSSPNHGVMLTLEAQPCGTVTNTSATNGDISYAAWEPSSSSSTTPNNNSGSHLPMHLTDSSHFQPQRYHPPYHFKVHHLFPDERSQDAVLRKNLPPLQYKVHDSAFCRVLSADTTAAALVAATVCSGGIDRDIWKCGYLRKQKHGHKRFFVLRGPSNLGPSRLEYYDSEKKFRNALKVAASGVTCPAKRVIFLSQCFTVNKRADAKNKYLIALYTKDEYFAMAAENEQDQEDWYLALSELMTEGKKLDTDELDDGYGTISPGTVFKEVWQVSVKPKGLGQTKNLMGVYRLCLSAKTIHLVKLNSETPAVNLPLMNIRRCGHSESFFFIEVGRSSSIGPGEIWVQVEDSVVAQNMHEIILNTMKALKAFPDFRPRSKSQSSGSNPVPFITTRRHLGNHPPSQTGLQCPLRTDSVTCTLPTGKTKEGSQRYRTSSEGEETQDRPLSSGTGSLVHLNTPVLDVGREEIGSCCAHVSPGSTHHTRSASLPVSHFLSATSPISVSSSSGHGSASDTHTHASSSSICGSPSDGGFNSSDEFCPSPCDFRYFHASCTTPESHGNTPPIREDYRLTEYWHKNGARTFKEESSYREKSFLKLAYSSKPKLGSGLGNMQQKVTQTLSSLDESSPVESKHHQVCSCLLNSAYKSCSELHHPNKSPLLSCKCQKKLHKDNGYMSMMYSTDSSINTKYIAMQPRANHPATLDNHAFSLQHSNRYDYMMMLPGDSPSTREKTEYDNYMDMSHTFCGQMRENAVDRFSQPSPEGLKSYSSSFSLPHSYRASSREKQEKTEYVPMSHDEPPSTLSPREYIHMNFGSSHNAVSPSSVNSPSNPPPSQPCYQHCCSSPDHDYLGLNMDSLLKDRPPRHSLVAPWNPPNYARPLGCSYSQTSTHFDTEKIHSGYEDDDSPSEMMQHLCIAEWLSLSQTEHRIIRSDLHSRRRHSSETFNPSSGSSASGCSVRLSTNQNLLEATRWQNCDSMWSHSEASRDFVNAATGEMHQNTSSSYLNYIALDLRQLSMVTHNTPPTHPAHSNLQETEAYAGIDFSVSEGHATASKE